MPARFVARLGSIAVVVLLAVPAGAGTSDPIPAVSSYTFTENLEPLGISEHAEDITNSDLAFWENRAFQGTYDGFRILDISDPVNPTEILDYEDCSGGQGDLIVWEDILVRSWDGAATVDESCDGETVPPGFEGLHIFDISDESDPALLANVPFPTCGSHTATGIPDLANDRLIVYNNASNANHCAGIDIVEVPLGDPGNPTVLGRFDTGRSCHDTAVILGDAMLAACAGGTGLSMLSIGGPGGGSLEAPVELWSKTVEQVTVGHAASFSWDGSIVAFGHEPGGGVSAECEEEDADTKKTMFFYRAVDGKLLGKFILPRPQTNQENCTIHNFNVVPSESRRVLVAGNYQAGISVVDFTNPAQPREIAYADPAPLQPTFDGGDWSTYWYDGTIYEGDITRGVITWRLNDPAVAGARTLGHLNPQTQESTIPFTGAVETVRCKGKAVTLFGTLESDTLKGTKQRDVILGDSGNDRIRGGKGNDVICGGKGRDRLRGQAGNDVLVGQGGRDQLIGQNGDDVCASGPGRDRLRGCERGKA